VDDVVPLLGQGLLVPDAVIEKVALPGDAEVPGGVALPVADDPRHRTVGTEHHEGMNVVGHEEEQPRPPIAALCPDEDALRQARGRRGNCQLVDPSGKAVHRDEERRPLRDPRRDLVREVFAIR